MTSGGQRPGAGRPKEPRTKQIISARVSPEVHEFLKSQPNASETIDQAIRRLKEFKASQPKT